MTRKHQPTDPSPRPFHDSNRPTAITQALAQDGEQAARDRAAAPSRAAVNAMARVLIAEWERVEAPVTPSYIATFADLARAALTYTTASERSGK